MKLLLRYIVGYAVLFLLCYDLRLRKEFRFLGIDRLRRDVYFVFRGDIIVVFVKVHRPRGCQPHSCVAHTELHRLFGDIGCGLVCTWVLYCFACCFG